MLVRPLAPELAEKAKIELNETRNNLEEDIRLLKEWIKKCPHLKARTDDQWLAAFVRGCKHNLERTKQKLDLYYSLRTIYPDLFAFRPSNPKFQELLQTGATLIIPKLSRSVDPRLVIAKPGLYDPNKFCVSDFFSFSHIFQQILYLEDDAFLVNGSIAILDLEGISKSHIFQMTPMQIKKLIIAGQDASPLRLKSLHIINCLPIFEKVFNMAQKLLNEKHRQRIFIHSENISALHKLIPKDILPEQYGGNGGTVQEIIDYWLKKLDEYGPWLDEDLKYGTDESLRPLEQNSTADGIFILNGSFKKVEVD